MPQDKRLYMTFPNDFHRHPKVLRLPVEARWVFVEMNGEARLADNDGVFAAEEAEFLWDPLVLQALVDSHPTRPLVERVGGTYVIRDYSEHQQTRAQREDLSAKRAAAGARGGQARVKQLLSKSEQSQAEIEIETETEISPSNEGDSARKRAHSIPKSFSISPEMRAWAATETPLVDIDAKLPEFIDFWTGTGKAMKDWVATWRNGMRKQQGFAERDRAPRTNRDDENMAVVARLAAQEQRGIEA